MNYIQALMNPQKAYEEMIKTNPQFKKFVEDNQGKSVEQIAKENGIDPKLISSFIK